MYAQIEEYTELKRKYEALLVMSEEATDIKATLCIVANMLKLVSTHVDIYKPENVKAMEEWKRYIEDNTNHYLKSISDEVEALKLKRLINFCNGN